MGYPLNPKSRSSLAIGPTGHTEFLISSPHGVKEIIAQWDNDKIISLQLEYNDGTLSEVAGKTGDGHARQYFSINYQELSTFKYRDSGYGHGSLRSFEVVLASGAKFCAGPDGYDHQVSVRVDGCYLLGFHGTANKDGFISSFGIIISAQVTEVKIFDLQYRLDQKTISKPESLAVHTVVNDQTDTKAGQGAVVFREKFKRRTTNDWSSAFTNGQSTSITITGGPPELSLSHMTTDSSSQTDTKGGSISETVEEEYTVTVNGTPGERAECQVLKTRTRIQVPFSGKMFLRYSDGTKLEDNIGGVFEATEETYTAKFINGTGSLTPVVYAKLQAADE